MIWQTAYSRRGWLIRQATGLVATASMHWMSQLANASLASSGHPAKRRCLLLWMNGGPSQTDTFDLKTGHENGGPFQSIQTSVPGISISEHLPGVSQWMQHFSIIRSMSTKEGDHGRASQQLRTGYVPQGAIEYPVLGSLISHAHIGRSGDLPKYVSILPRGLFRAGQPAAGFLGPEHSPLLIGSAGRSADGYARLSVDNLTPPVTPSSERASSRQKLLEDLQADFLRQHPGAASDGHLAAYEKGQRLMSPEAVKTFQLDQEDEATRVAYGISDFGQGCLLARRLLEKEVPFVEVSLSGWDTHNENFTQVKSLSAVLDQAWSALMKDLVERDLLASTTIIWMGEFGRTPAINPQVGRDHYPKAWSVLVGGAGIQGEQLYGRTSADGMVVDEDPVTIPDLLTTIMSALEIDPAVQNMSNVNRPIARVDASGNAIQKLLA